MDTQVSWSKNSIIDISSDPIYNQEGTVTKAALALTLGPTSKASFQYTYGQDEKLIRTNKLRAILIATSSDTNQLTRYNNNIEVEIQIQYYEEQINTSTGETAGFTDGSYDNSYIEPYLQSESRDGLIDEFIIDIENKFIKTILVTFINKSQNTITFRSPRLYPSLDVEDTIKESGISGQAAEIASMEGYSDGIVVWYKDEERPAFIKIIPQTENIKLYNVSDRYTFGYTGNSSPMPYGRTDNI